MEPKNRLFPLFGVFAVTASFLGVLFGAVTAAPAPSVELSAGAAYPGGAAIAPSNRVTGSVDVDARTQPEGQAGGEGGAPATTRRTTGGSPRRARFSLKEEVPRVPRRFSLADVKPV